MISLQRFCYSFLLEELEKAEHHIFLEYFVVAGGEMWSAVLDVLIRKAQAGVDVRLIYDGVGSAPTLPAGYPETLEAVGVRCRPFQPFRPVLSIHQNNRDHRKLLVVDGVTGAVGGLNLADEYIGKKDRFGVWKDNALLLRGEAVWSLEVFFLDMWDREGEETDYELFRPAHLPPVTARSSAPNGSSLPHRTSITSSIRRLTLSRNFSRDSNASTG